MRYVITEQQYRSILEQWYNPFSWFGKKSECSPKEIQSTNWKGLYSELVNKKLIKNGNKLIIVWGPNQTAYYTQDGKSTIRTFKVSTGSNGFGNEVDSKKTPTGLLEVTGKIKARPFEVLVFKSPTGTILGPNKDSSRVDPQGVKHAAEVLTGIMELDGLENCNDNAFSRNIYFHGTNKENGLGSPRSNGCIRVSNSDIQWMLSNIPDGTKVYVKP